jgi:hypothetical protein
MFGRTTRFVLLLLASQLLSGCCWCHRPWFWRHKWHGGCCEPTTCCSAPGGFPGGAVAPPHGMPVYTGAPVAVPTAPVAPAGNPASDRIPPISSAVMSNVR